SRQHRQPVCVCGCDYWVGSHRPCLSRDFSIRSKRNGNVAPSKSIAGPSTSIIQLGQIAVDSAGTVYAANTPVTGAGGVLIFGSGATGDAAPTATLAGSNTTIYNIRGVAVDGSGNIYVASLAQASPENTDLSGTPSILEFSAGSTG